MPFKSTWTGEEVTALCTFLEKGWSQGEIAIEIGKTRNAVGQKIVRLGLTLDPKEALRRKRHES